MGVQGLIADQRLLVVCPAYNEAASVAAVVADIRRAMPTADVLVVDDGSTDGTADAALAAGARVLQLPFNIGVGGALRAGLLLAQRERYDVFVQCDADGQHPSDGIPALVAATSDADIVIGSRWGSADGYTAGLTRRIAMRALAKTLSAVHHTRLDDVTSGFRAFSRRALEVLARELPPEYLGDTVDALMIAKFRHLRVAQVTVVMRPRETGAPSQNSFRAALYLMRAALLIVLSLGRMVTVDRRSAS
jgi:glycosyltransferase involved in cell wall biosynthesis